MIHISLLYLIPFVLYAHTGYFLHQVQFKPMSIIANDKIILANAEVILTDLYFGAFLVYLGLALIYYRVSNFFKNHFE